MTREVILKQSYELDAERLFALLSTPAALEQWLSPSDDIPMRVVEHQFEVGGQYRFHYHQPDGERLVVEGEFTEITPPTHISFTWQWLEPDRHAARPTLVSWILSATGASTELTVVHSQMPDDNFAERHQQGWQATLMRLQRFVSVT